MLKTEIIEKGLERFYKEKEKNNEFGIPDSLPVVDKFCKERFPGKNIFSKTNVLFIQHLLAPSVRRLEAMIKYGCNPDKCWFVDIPYSTSYKIKKECQKICDKQKFAKEYDNALEPYTVAQRKRLLDILRKIADSDGDLLIFDDGAYTIRTLKKLEKEEPKFVKKFCNRKISIVEQTTRGHRYFTEDVNWQEYVSFLIKHKISLVSIAKSKTKVELESPFIGAAVSSCMIDELQKIEKQHHKTLDRILVLGFGPVGKATTHGIIDKKIANKIEVSEIDRRLSKKIESVNAKFVPTLDDTEHFNPKSNGVYDAIVGCTGYSSFHPHNIGILNQDAILASGSSATVEFNRKDFLEKLIDEKTSFSIKNPREIKQKGIHSPISISKDHQTFTFLNAGFPVNFNGGTESQPFWTIQMTHALMIAAGRETIDAEPGFKALNADDDKWIHDNTLKNLDEYLSKKS